MATDENMAILFHKVGESDELAEKILAILQSHELERQMAEQNYDAGVEMTMANVVANYLRWFELKKSQSRIAKRRGRSAPANLSQTRSAPGLDNAEENHLDREQEAQFAGVENFASPFAEGHRTNQKNR
jgi:hypothetical protein